MIEQFLEKNRYFFKKERPAFKLCEDVKKQALSHMLRRNYGDLIDQERPNEPEEVKKYRKLISRNFTREGIEKITDIVGNILTNSGFSINTGQDLADYLKSSPFYVGKVPSDLHDYLIKCIAQQMFTDPNAVWVSFPLQDVADLPDNVPLVHDHTIVDCKNIVHFDKNLFAWYGGVMEYNDKKSRGAFYWIADNKWWYRYEPTGRRDEKGQIYELNKWYFHNTTFNGRNILPIAMLPGVLVKDNGIEYNETYAATFYEMADDFAMSYSDNQATRVLHNHPKFWMKDMPCPAENCNGGKMIEEDGGFVVDIQKKGADKYSYCKSCSGTGTVQSPGHYSYFKVPQDISMDGKTGGDAPAGYIEPSQNIKVVWDCVWELYDRMMKSMGLNSVGGAAESGEAKKIRLQDLENKVSKIGLGLLSFTKRVLIILESSNVPNIDERVNPSVYAPESWKIRDYEQLQSDAKDALNGDRLNSALMALEQKYQGDPNRIRMSKLMYRYSPELAIPHTEIKDLMLIGCITTNDCIRIKRTQWAANIIEENMADKTDDQILKEFETLVNPFLQTITGDRQVTEG